MTDRPDDWVLVDFRTAHADADAVSDILWGAGVVAIEEIAGEDGRTVLRTSLGDRPQVTVDAVLAAFPGVSVSSVVVPSAVADTWRETVTPTRVVDDIWLVPAWCAPPPGRAVFIEPFDTFGLGNHPTTILTLQAALAVVKKSSRVVDLGSGSGVLSVALAVLTGCAVSAHDIAPQGEQALAHNAALNGVTGLVSWRGPLAASDAALHDLVMANILAPVLRELAPAIEHATRPGGAIVLSGIRYDQVDDVTERFARSDESARSELDGWCAVTLRRR